MIFENYHVIGNSSSNLLIFLHGWQSNGSHIRDSLDWPRICEMYDLRVIIPTAINQEWFSYDEPNAIKVNHFATRQETLQIKELRENFDLFLKGFNDVKTKLIAGYSQGGSIALDIGLSNSAIDAVWVSSASVYANLMRTYDKTKAIYLYHGSEDTVFPVNRVEIMKKKFTNAYVVMNATTHWEFMLTKERTHFFNFLSNVTT